MNQAQKNVINWEIGGLKDELERCEMQQRVNPEWADAQGTHVDVHIRRLKAEIVLLQEGLEDESVPVDPTDVNVLHAR